jgi:MFS family permease
MYLNHLGKPSVYLPCCMVGWGVLSIMTGQLLLTSLHLPDLTSCGRLRQQVNIKIHSTFLPSHNHLISYTGALLIRFSLGFVEAAFFPGALFLLSKWYKRGELGLRTAVLFCGGLISNAFGTLLASAILDSMEGKLGRAAWRYISRSPMLS